VIRAPHDHEEAEPTRLAVGRGFDKLPVVFQTSQELAQQSPVAPAGRDEGRQLRELNPADRGLDVGGLQVVPDVAVHVLVVVAFGEGLVGVVSGLARLGGPVPLEPLAAGVVLAAVARAVAAPVAEARGGELEPRVGGVHRAALAHGDVMGWVEAGRTEMAEGPGESAPIEAPESIAVVLDQVEVVRPAELPDGIEIERVAQGMGEHDGPRLVAEGVVEPVTSMLAVRGSTSTKTGTQPF